jgi:hypothetical protein
VRGRYVKRRPRASFIIPSITPVTADQISLVRTSWRAHRRQRGLTHDGLYAHLFEIDHSAARLSPA